MAKVYRQAKDLIITHKLFRLVRYAELEGVRQLTISNLWRIERFADGAIRILEHDLVHDAWVEVEDLAGWPEVPFFPVRETRTLDWWREIARKAIWKALNAAGYAELPQYRRLVTRWVEVKGSPFPVPAPGQQEMSAAHMAYRMIERYIGKQVKVKGKTGVYRWKGGLLESKSMQAGARALRAGFFEHILDGEVLSAMRVIDYRNCSFTRYLSYARWREGLLKVAREHRNLLPLLRRINPEQWTRNNLFSRTLWVRGGRRFTALDRRPVRPAWGAGIEGDDYWRVCSFDDGAAWRWLSRASSVVVKEWRGGRAIVTHLALAKVSVRVPVCAYVHVLRAAERRQESIERYAGSYPGQLQQLLRVYLIHCAMLWKEQGHGYVRGWLRSEAGNVSNMLDYLMNEGFDRGQHLKQVAKYVQDPRIKALLLDRDDGKAGERGGIGTPATRAAMLGKLQERGFYTIEKKKLVPTALGVAFIQALPRIATTPDMTALWHEQQVMIERGELSVDAFLDELEAFIGEQISTIDLGDMPIAGRAGVEPLAARCPMCGGELARTAKVVGCKGCEFRMYPSIAGKELTTSHLESLLSKGKTSLIKGFRNKEGKAFDAALRLDGQGKVVFDFPKTSKASKTNGKRYA
ncbi:type IA DNA topoisomerase [Pseudomonas aeruginosa]|uniref:type IA DNA topoisomerase n=1 Tax=Pseudomonas aeruginosa TaxID=287 RepID=UPI0031B7FF19